MQIVDPQPEHEHAWLHCLEPYAEEIRAGVPRKKAWVEQMWDRGLLVKLALDDDGAVAGMIQALPIEESHVLGEGLYFVFCIWVHGHRRGIGDRRGRGMGSALLAAAEEEARARGALGMAAWGLAVPVWMRSSWFRKQGYRRADRQGLAALVYKPFGPEARPPRWMRRPRLPALERGKRTVTCLSGGWCTLQNANCERARAAAQQTGAAFREIDVSNPVVARYWRQADAIYVDHRQIARGPPLTEERIRRHIERRSLWSRLRDNA